MKAALAKTTGLTLFYLITGGATVLGYGVVQAVGWEPGTEKAEVVPPSVRNSPGGYRTWHIWHSGYQGGK
jgi:hypothetical protein